MNVLLESFPKFSLKLFSFEMLLMDGSSKTSIPLDGWKKDREISNCSKVSLVPNN